MDNIVVLGATGVVGREFCRLLQEKKAKYYKPDRYEYDAIENNKGYYNYFQCNSESIVVNLLAEKTNIQRNKKEPVTICANTLRMNMNVLDICSAYKVKKLINVISSCAYPGNCVEPMSEDYFWNGSPHESILPHGEAKRCVYALSQFYRQQFRLNVVCIAFNSLYSNTCWNRPETLKVLESMVKKIVDAREANLSYVTFFGSGSPRREFLHVKDAAESILQVIEKYDDSEILNIGNNFDIQIKKLAEGIKLAVGYKGQIKWDNGQDGQMRKMLCSEKMERVLNWSPKVKLADGIQETIEDYEKYLKLESD